MQRKNECFSWNFLKWNCWNQFAGHGRRVEFKDDSEKRATLEALLQSRKNPANFSRCEWISKATFYAKNLHGHTFVNKKPERKKHVCNCKSQDANWFSISLTLPLYHRKMILNDMRFNTKARCSKVCLKDELPFEDSNQYEITANTTATTIFV